MDSGITPVVQTLLPGRGAGPAPTTIPKYLPGNSRETHENSSDAQTPSPHGSFLIKNKTIGGSNRTNETNTVDQTRLPIASSKPSSQQRNTRPTDRTSCFTNVVFHERRVSRTSCFTKPDCFSRPGQFVLLLRYLMCVPAAYKMPDWLLASIFARLKYWMVRYC